MKLIFEQVRTGGDRNFGYLLGDREAKVAALIDPSYAPDQLIERATVQGMEVKYLLNTHSHHDHTNGNRAVINTGATLLQESTPLGHFHLELIPVPGHCPDHIVIFVPEYKIALTGDHLFVGKIGGTATEEDARTQYDSFMRLFDILPPDTTIWPGHDYGCRPSSTLALERATNPFLLVENFDKFYALKLNWPSFKKEKGLK